MRSKELAVSRSGPSKVLLLCRAQCAVETKCYRVQTIGNLLHEDMRRNGKPFVQPDKSDKHQCYLLSDSTGVKVDLCVDLWEPTDLIYNMCGEYYEMMRTS